MDLKSSEPRTRIRPFWQTLPDSVDAVHVTRASVVFLPCDSAGCRQQVVTRILDESVLPGYRRK